MEDEFHVKPCDYCNATGKLRDSEYPCLTCKGQAVIKRRIEPIQDHFVKVNEWATDTAECDECKSYYGLEGDWCERETNDYEDTVFRCECGSLLDLSGSWDYTYYISSNNIKQGE